MLIRIILLLVALQFPFATPAGSQAPESLNAKLNKRLTNYTLGVSNFVEALVRVSAEFQIPMGIAWINTAQARAQLPFAWKDATTGRIIEEIVKTQPAYEVQIRNGVAHVAPSGVIPTHENFLTLKVPEFNVRKQYVEFAIMKLHDSITPSKSTGFSLGAMTEPRITVELKDATVEDVLDALAMASTRKIWIVTFSTDPTPTRAGFRRTLTLWDSLSPIPEEGEPALNLLHWGDKIPWPASAER